MKAWYEEIRVRQAKQNAEALAEAERIQREHQADLDARAEAYRTQREERIRAVEERNRIRAEERAARLHELMNPPGDDGGGAPQSDRLRPGQLHRGVQQEGDARRCGRCGHTLSRTTGWPA